MSITITTDFGDQFATSQLKAVVFGLGYSGQIIENHDVVPFSVLEGGYAIWQLAKFCPKGTIHLGVVDPGVGSERKGIVVQTNNFWFVGPDNGLLWPAAERDGILSVWRINENKFGQVAQTFHGRDVFIKVAGELSLGKKPEELGCVVINLESLVKTNFKKGQVLHIDSYGNIKFYWPNIVRPGENLFGIPVVNTFSDVDEGEPLILNGSSETLELAVNLGSGKDKYGLKLGELVHQEVFGHE